MNFDQIVAALIAGDITEKLLDTLLSMSVDDLKRIEGMVLKNNPHPFQHENALKVLMHCGYYDGAKYPIVSYSFFNGHYYDALVGTYILADGMIYIKVRGDLIKWIVQTLPNLRTKTHLLASLNNVVYLDGVRYKYEVRAGVNIVVAEFHPTELEPEYINTTIYSLTPKQVFLLQSSHLKEIRQHFQVMNRYIQCNNITEKVNYILTVENFERYPFSLEPVEIAKAVKAIKQATGIEKTRLGLAMSDEDLEKYKPYIQDDEFIAKIKLFKSCQAELKDNLSLFCKVFTPATEAASTTTDKP